MITLADIKEHLRLDAGDIYEEMLLTRYHRAAKQAVSNHIDRNLYEVSEQIPPDDKNGLKIDDALEAAILLLIGHFYENRESVSDEKLYTVPVSYYSLVQPYRKIGV